MTEEWLIFREMGSLHRPEVLLKLAPWWASRIFRYGERYSVLALVVARNGA